MTYTKEQATEGISKLITDYEELKKRKTARKERLEDIGEANVRANFIDPLFEILGWNVRNPDEYDRENYVRGAGFVDIALKLSDRSGITAEDKAKVFIEAKRFGGVPNLTDRTFQKTLLGKTIYADWTEEERQILNYASKTLDVKWAILTNFEKFRLFNARTGVTVLNIEKPEELLERIDELLFLTKDSIETDRIDILETRIERPDVDNEFLDLMNTWRLKIAKSIYENNRNKTFEIKDEKIALSFNSEEEREKSLELIKEATQRILDRLIIVKYAEDKFVIDPEQLEEKNRSWKRTKDYSSLFYELNGFFRGFWGKHDSKIFKPDHICEKVQIDDGVLSDIIDGICGMNFRKFTSDILGNTYESYLGHELYFNESEELNIRPNQQLKKSGGIYYTPSYIVNHIVENTLGIKLEEIWNDVEKLLDKGEYKEGYNRFKDVSKIKVLDPACGSGSFLVKAFNLIKNFYERYNGKIEEIQQIKHKEFVEKEGNQLNLEEERFLTKILNFDKQILKDTIYGVDLDPAACEIASVNLMLQALKRGEELPLILDENIKVGNSLISGSNKELEVYFENLEKTKPFNWEKEFKDIFLVGGFDVVIGNPPWVSIKGKQKSIDLSEKELDYLFETYPCDRYRPNLFEMFVWRGLSLVKEGGYFGFIVPDRLCYNSQFTNLRKYILKNFTLKKLWFRPIFGGVISDNIIFTIKRYRAADKSQVEIAECPSMEFKRISQGIYADLSDYSWFIVDDNILNIFEKIKLKKDVSKLGDVFKTQVGFIAKPNKVTKTQQNKNQIKVIKGENIRRFIIKDCHYFEFKKENLAGGTQDENKLSKKNKVLLRKTGADIIALYDNTRIYPEQSVYFIYTDNNEQDKLKVLCGLLNSKLLNCYYKNFAVTNRDSTPQLKKVDLDRFPIIMPNNLQPLIKLVDYMLILNKQKNALLDLFKDLIKKFRQDEEFKPLSDYYTTKKSISLEDYTEDRAHRENGINKYRLNIVKSQELIDYKEVGKITKIDCEEKGNFLILRVRLEGEKDFEDMLKIYFEDELVMRFFYFSIKVYLLEKERKKYWSKEEIWEVLNEIKIPRSVPNVDADVRNIKQLMKTFEEAYMEKLSEEFKESPVKELNLTKIEEEIEKTDNQINQKVYELYGLTKEEIEIIEKSL